MKPGDKLLIVKSTSIDPIVKHFHNMNEIIYIEQGCIDLTISGVVSRVSAPALIFISSLEIHGIAIKITPYVRYYVLIPNTILHHMQDGSYLGSIFVKNLSTNKYWIDVTPIKRDVDQLFSTMTDEFNDKASFGNQYIVNCLNCLLIKILRAYPDLFISQFSSKEDTIYKVKTYIETNYLEKLTIEQLATHFYLSPSFLAHTFKTVIGVSPKQYIMSYRLTHARDLLVNSSETISDIALLCGFKDVNNFIRFFKRELGISPLRYRKGKITE